MSIDDRPVRVTLDLGPYASRMVKLLTRIQGGTHTSAAKAMVDLGCKIAEPQIDSMSAALAPPGENVKEWQDSILNAEPE